MLFVQWHDYVSWIMLFCTSAIYVFALTSTLSDTTQNKKKDTWSISPFLMSDFVCIRMILRPWHGKEVTRSQERKAPLYSHHLSKEDCRNNYQTDTDLLADFYHGHRPPVDRLHNTCRWAEICPTEWLLFLIIIPSESSIKSVLYIYLFWNV